jgi:hypothetical protein
MPITMKTSLAIMAALLLAACNLEEINRNPNVPDQVPVSTLLPPAQKALADAQGGRIFRYTGIFGQQLRGIDGQELLIEAYQPDEFFVDNPWADVYVDAMLNLRIIIDRSENQSPHYAGVARVLTAYALGLLTDIWGQVPFTDALGASQHPLYDSQESIYINIQSLLAQAITELQSPASVRSPGADDLYYGGNLQAWIRAARVLQARHHLRTLKRNPNAPTLALEALQSGGFTAVADDLAYRYLGTGDDINPSFGFFQNVASVTIDSLYIQRTQGAGDPRYNPHLTRVIPFTGGRRRPGDYYARATASVRLVSYMEQEFIRAECLYRTGDVGGAEQTLQQVVALHMQELNTVVAAPTQPISQQQIDNFVSQQLQLTGNEDSDLNIILTQKWIALLCTPEPWADFRRTGLPQLMPNANGVTDVNPNGQIPRRLIYPQSERLRNNNFPRPAPHMQVRFWWDVD